MNFDILNSKPLEFFNESGELMGHVFISGSSGDLHLATVSGSNGDVIIGDRNTVGDVEIGLPSAQSTLKLMGGGTISANGNTLTIGDISSGDNVIVRNATSSLSVNGTQRTLYTTASFKYTGDNLTQVTQSFQAGTQQITNIVYGSDGPTSVAVTGSDGINKLYTLTYNGSNITEIKVT